MGLNVAVFIPEGIVVASDTMAFIRTEDEGYFSSSERTFTCLDRFVISFVGNGYVEDMPYGYVINNFLSLGIDVSISTPYFAKKFNSYISQFKIDGPITVYIAGIDKVDHYIVPFLYLLDKGKITRLNAPTEEEMKQFFYNYHVAGQSLWINKLFLPTSFMDSKTHNNEEFVGVNIDFRRFSIEQAISFATFLLKTSSCMELYTQMRPMVNDRLTICLITPYTHPQIIHK